MNGLFGLNGLTGFLIAVVLLLAIVFFLGYAAITTQHAEALNSYKIQNSTAIPMNSANMEQHYKVGQ